MIPNSTLDFHITKLNTMDQAGTGKQGVAKDPSQDKRHGDPAAGGKTSGQKAADTRAETQGTQIHYTDKK